MRRAAGQDEAAGGQRRRLDAPADGREALAQARDAAAVAVARLPARTPSSAIRTTTSSPSRSTAISQRSARVWRSRLVAPSRTSEPNSGCSATGTASGVPSTAASTPAALQDPDRVGELDGEPDAPVALDQLARLAQRLERQRVGVARVAAGELVVDPDQPRRELRLERDRLQLVALDVVQVAGEAQPLAQHGDLGRPSRVPRRAAA